MDFNISSSSYECDLKSFQKSFFKLHGWISMSVSIFGSIANIVNILVLTRREMRSPTNIILTGLAVADLLVMIDYIPYAFHIHLYERSKQDTYTYGWAIFVLFHSSFSQVCHTISISLTLILAVWRYIAVAMPQRNREWCNYKRTILAIVLAYVFCPVLCIPVYFTTKVTEQVETINETLIDWPYVNTINATLYTVQLTEAVQNQDIVNQPNFWIYSVVIKLFPCVVLTIVSLKLLQILLEAQQRRRKLTNVQGEGLNRKKSSKRMDKERQTDRTTMMLLVVLFLFLLTELPQGILGLLSVVYGEGFFRTCYSSLGDVIDALTLVNCAINFILYCTMSRQFRKTFSELFCKNWKCPKTIGKQILMENNGNTGANHTVTQVTQV